MLNEKTLFALLALTGAAVADLAADKTYVAEVLIPALGGTAMTADDIACNMGGVTCDGDAAIVGIDIEDMGLSSGGVPDSIGALSGLTKLSGAAGVSVDDAAFTLPALTEFGGFVFANGLPAALGQASNLESLQFAETTNSSPGGTMPAELAGLTALKAFTAGDLAYGEIPDFLFHENLESFTLTWVLNGNPNLSFQNVTGAVNLHTFSIDHAYMSAGFPADFDALTSLTNLMWRHTAAPGNFPKMLAMLPALETLELGQGGNTWSYGGIQAGLEDGFVAELCKNSGATLKSLSFHSMNGNSDLDHISAMFDDVWADCTALEHLDLRNNAMSEVPSGLDQLSSLTTLDISDNYLGLRKKFAVADLKALLDLGIETTTYGSAKNQIVGTFDELTAALPADGEFYDGLNCLSGDPTALDTKLGGNCDISDGIGGPGGIGGPNFFTGKGYQLGKVVCEKDGETTPCNCNPGRSANFLDIAKADALFTWGMGAADKYTACFWAGCGTEFDSILEADIAANAVANGGSFTAYDDTNDQYGTYRKTVGPYALAHVRASQIFMWHLPEGRIADGADEWSYNTLGLGCGDDSVVACDDADMPIGFVYDGMGTLAAGGAGKLTSMINAEALSTLSCYLKEISLPNNDLKGAVPDLSAFTMLEKLDLGGNANIAGAVPDLSGISGLTMVNLCGTGVTADDVPAAIKDITLIGVCPTDPPTYAPSAAPTAAPAEETTAAGDSDDTTDPDDEGTDSESGDDEKDSATAAAASLAAVSAALALRL